MSRVPLGRTAKRLMTAAGRSLSAHEANQVRIVLPWIEAFFVDRNTSLATAAAEDLTAFCEERAKRRNPGSMARLVSTLRAAFRAAVAAGIREDNPALLLSRPQVEMVRPNYTVDRAQIENVIDLHKRRSAGSNEPAIASRSRMLAVLHLCSVGINFVEMTRLDLSDLNRSIVVARGCPNERPIRPSKETRAVLRDWVDQRTKFALSEEKALLISLVRPRGRLTEKSAWRIMAGAIRQAGLSSAELKPAMFYKSVSAKIVADGLGWSLAADVAHRRQVPRVRREPTPIEEMALKIERFHPFGKMSQNRSKS
jgi:site-specific recombinase XerD